MVYGSIPTSTAVKCWQEKRKVDTREMGDKPSGLDDRKSDLLCEPVLMPGTVSGQRIRRRGKSMSLYTLAE